MPRPARLPAATLCPLLILALTLALTLAAALPGPARAELGDPPPDMPDMLPILEERFDGPLSRRTDAAGATTGLWDTVSLSGALMTNAAKTVFLDSARLPPGVDPADLADLPPTLEVTPEGLALRTIALPEPARAAVAARMEATGQGGRAGDALYATGRITTADTWAQKYGWFEIEARIPRGKGRWPAFWLLFAGPGWPPEIDIFEAYGAGIAAPTPKDGRFHTAVHFDALDGDRRPVHSVDIENPFDADPERRQPHRRQRGGGDVYRFMKMQQDDALGGDIYGDVNTYAALWTPEEIVYYFGPDRASLREIFRVPTPEDAREPMILIANDHFTARGGWWPEDDDLEAALDPDNTFLIRSITVRAPRPDVVLDLGAGDGAFDPRSSVIRGTPGDDVIAPGPGFDLVQLEGGADTVQVSRGREGTVIEGFGPDDRLVLDGFAFDAAGAHGRLTQVGADVWLSSGADPHWPQSVILRDVAVADVAPGQIASRWPVGSDIWATRADLPREPMLDDGGTGRLEAPEGGGWLSDGGAAVRMTGGAGPDRYMASHPDTTIAEPAEGGGIDTLIAWGRRALPGNVERGILRGRGGRLIGGPGDDRLEAEGENGTLEGRGGDDLYVIDPKVRAVSVAIGAGPGHDRLRGWGPEMGLRLQVPAALRPQAAVTAVPEGALVTFSPEKSLLVEGATAAEAEALLPQDG